VCVSDTEQKRKSFMQKNDYTFEGGLDKDNSIGNKYQITGIPTSILIDADGKIQKINVGMMTAQKLKDFVKDYISF
ncbi:MAG: redoxin domain-containing protein, partial [Treponema sp.]|nr:redoxin domain-containing protein [Treponema sp.]